MPINPNRRKVKIAYTADDGLQYAYQTTANHAAAVNATSGDGLPAFPTRWEPRKIHGKQINPTGRDRKLSLVVPTRISTLWTGPLTSFTVQPYGLLDFTGSTGERRTIAAPDYNGVATPPNELVAIAYTSEQQGQVFRLVTSRAHAAAVNAQPAGNAPAYPKAWTPRHYGLLNPDFSGADQRMVLVEPNPQSANWVSDAPVTINVGGTAFGVTGRMTEDRTEGAPGYTP